MWCAEGSVNHQSASCRQLAAYGMDPRRFKGFLKAHRRKNAWNTSRKHCLAAPGHADHQHVVSACGCDFNRASGPFLSFDLCQVNTSCRFFLQCFKGNLFLLGDSFKCFKPFYNLFQMAHRKNAQTLNAGYFPCVFFRQDHSADSVFLGADCHGKRSVDRLHTAVQAQFTEKSCFFKICTGIRMQLSC